MSTALETPARIESYYRSFDAQVNAIRELVYRRAWEIAEKEQGEGNPPGHWTQNEGHLWKAWEELRGEAGNILSQLSKVPTQKTE